MTALTKEERTAQLLRAVDNAKATLVPGDVLMVTRCGGLKVRYVFKSWDGNWATSIMRNDISPTNIYKVNGRPVDFTSRTALSNPAASQD